MSIKHLLAHRALSSRQLSVAAVAVASVAALCCRPFLLIERRVLPSAGRKRNQSRRSRRICRLPKTFSLDLRVPKQATSPSSLPSLRKTMPARPDRPSEEPGKLNPTVHLLLSLSLPLLGTFTNFRGLKQRGIEKVVKVLSSLGRPLV